MKFLAFVSVVVLTASASFGWASVKDSARKSNATCGGRMPAAQYFSCHQSLRGNQPFDAKNIPGRHARFEIEVRTGCDAHGLNDNAYADCLNKFIQEKNAAGKTGCWSLVEPDAFNKCLTEETKAT